MEDNFLTLLFLIISCVSGIVLSLFLHIRSYIIIAINCLTIFACIMLYYNYNKIKNETTKQNAPTTSIKSLVSALLKPEPTYNPITITADGSLLSVANKQVKSNSVIADMLSIYDKSSINDVRKPYDAITNTVDVNKPPLDGLQPDELVSRLNYIHYATANPLKMISYEDYKTHADKYIELTKHSNSLLLDDDIMNDDKKSYYPFLTKNNINAHDCLNDGVKGCMITEQFTMPLDPKDRNTEVLFYNAPLGNLDKPLDQQSNETLDLSTYLPCSNCKLATCVNNYCMLQNKLFI